MTSLRRPHGARLATAFVAVLALLGQATALVHEAATPHVTCLEHGERVHLTVSATRSPVEGLAIEAAPREPSTHAHDHCSVQSQRGTTAPTPARAFVAAHFFTAPAPTIPRVERALRLLRLAPKTSPPRTPVA